MPTTPSPTALFYGDTRYILRDHIPDAGIDLVCLDPPFNFPEVTRCQ